MKAGEVRIEIIGDSSKLDPSLKRAEERLKKFKKDMEKNGRVDATVHLKGINKAVSQAKKYEQSLKSLSKAQKIQASQTGKSEKANSRYVRAMRKAADASALVTGPLGGVASRFSILARAATPAAAAVLSAGAAFGALTAGIAKSISVAGDFETSFLRLEGVVKATGNSAGFTASEIRAMTSDIALNTLASEKGMESAAAKLLTFKSVQGDVFKRALELSQDLADLGFGSVQSSATQLGRALEDPVSGLSALRRSGVSFTQSQKDLIKELVESNQTLEAQRLILDALSGQLSGTAVNAAKGMAGAVDTLGQKVSDFFRGIGDSGPLSSFTSLVNTASKAIDNINKVLFRTGGERINELMGEIMSLEERKANWWTRNDWLNAQIEERRKEIKAIQDARVEEQKKTFAAREAARQSKENADKERELAAEKKKQAELDKQSAKEAEKRARAVEREQQRVEQIAARRRETVSNAKSETVALIGIRDQYLDNKASLEDLMAAKEINERASSLGGTEAERQELVNILKTRRDIEKTIKNEEGRRALEASRAATIAGIQTEIASVEILSRAIGGNAQAQAEASVEADVFRYRQELINEAMENGAKITEEQMSSINSASDAYRTQIQILAEVEDAQKRAADAAAEQQRKTEEFQSTLADSFTTLIFNARGFKDSLKSMILEMSKAIVKAEILGAIQGRPNSSGFGSTVLGGLVGAAQSTASTAFGGFFGAPAVSNVVKFHSGGIVGGGGTPASVPSSNFIGAPRFHNGLMPNEVPAVLEKGEAVIPKNQVGNLGRSNTVNFNITTPDADSFRASRRQLSRKARTGGYGS